MGAFRDRRDAGRRLAGVLRPLAADAPIVAALPRGGVPVADEVATALQAPMDVLIVRKLGAPGNPELAVGAVGEGGVTVIQPTARAMLDLDDADLERIATRERDELARRVTRYRAGAPMIDVTGRTVILVDDGLATGATASAGVEALRAHGAARIIVAVPTGSREAVQALSQRADDVICLERPAWFGSVGEQYEDFGQTTDDDVVAILDAHRTRSSTIDRTVRMPISPGVTVAGRLVIPAHATGVIVFAHGSGSSRLSPRNLAVAESLNERGLGTLLFDLLTDDEAQDRRNVFDVPLLGSRLRAARAWLKTVPEAADLPVGLFGASTGAAAAITAAAHDHSIGAIVSRGGRPDLAEASLPQVTAPTLLIVGGLDDLVIDLNRQAMARMRCDTALDIVPGATHLFEEPGALERVSELAGTWFEHHLELPHLDSNQEPCD